MILFWQDDGRRLCEALDWSLYTVKGERVHLGSEQALAGYLRERPDTEFHLRNFRLREDMAQNREIENPSAADYGPESGNLFCGAVQYDSAADRMVNVPRKTGGRLASSILL